ncbi:unannotated protein [freshwater metagenome]|uniref:Unannotated protein n=1 Tax=freshwater metagenome TaxID=449393 RepID=A0A6J6VMB8_9ZZZZ
MLAFLGAIMILVGVAGNMIYTVKATSLEGTVFSEGIVLYLVYGGLLSALAALTHWAPALWGRVINDTKVIGLALIGLLGTVLAAFPLYIAGFSKQPADTVVGFDYKGPMALWNILSTLGHGLFIITVIGFVALLVDAIRQGTPVSQEVPA